MTQTTRKITTCDCCGANDAFDEAMGWSKRLKFDLCMECSKFADKLLMAADPELVAKGYLVLGEENRRLLCAALTAYEHHHNGGMVCAPAHQFLSKLRGNLREQGYDIVQPVQDGDDLVERGGHNMKYLEEAQIEIEKTYVCETYDGELVALKYYGDGMFDCNQSLEGDIRYALQEITLELTLR